MTNLPAPTFPSTIDQSFFVEPISGTSSPRNFLDRFPDDVYNKSPDSRLVKFMYALLGPAGVASIKENLVQFRLILEHQGIQLFNLEQFYSDPFSFGRLLDEIYDVDPTGLISHDEWSQIRAADEQYRARALTFFNGAQLGTTPVGMAMVAQSGLGHNVEIVENYRHLFDNHSIDPLGVPYMGQTQELREFIVIPRQNISRSSIQTLTFDVPFNSGSYVIGFNGKYTSPINWDDTQYTVQARLQALSTIGSGNVSVTGNWSGPQLVALTVTFTGALSNTSVSTLSVISDLQDLSTAVAPINRMVTVSEATAGIDPTNEIVEIRDADRHTLQTALDYTRSILGIPSVHPGTGLREIQNWRSVSSSSDAASIVQTVTGNPAINWPVDNPQFWIRQSIEVEAPRKYTDRLHHYVAFHRIKKLFAYTDDALEDPQYLNTTDILPRYRTEHPGRFSRDICRWVPFFITFNSEIRDDDFVVLDVDRARCEDPDLPLVRNRVDDESLIDGKYPISYVNLPDVDAPSITNSNRRFWASCDRHDGSDYLEIDLGQIRPVNYVVFETIRKPIDVEIEFDLLDQYPRRNWHPVTPNNLHEYPSSIYYDGRVYHTSPWQFLEYHFGDVSGAPIFTRHLRIRFTRRNIPQHLTFFDFIRFMFDLERNIQLPWSIDVRNLRVGRNITL